MTTALAPLFSLDAWQRLMDSVDLAGDSWEDDCWEWQRYISNGYGRLGVGTKQYYAHRLSWVWSTGEEIGHNEDGKRLVIDHLCRNKKCVNPNHLEPVTDRENTWVRGEMVVAGREMTHCRKGHPFNDENTYHHERDGGARRSCRTCINQANLRQRLKRQGGEFECEYCGRDFAMERGKNIHIARMHKEVVLP